MNSWSEILNSIFYVTENKCLFYTADLEERSVEEEEEEEGLESSASTDVGAGEGETAAIVSSDSGMVSAVGEKNPVSLGQTRGTFFSA